MAAFDPSKRPGTPSHLLADEKEVSKVLAELPSLEPVKALGDAAASLQSLELATSFGIGQRLNLVSTLDEAVQRSLAQVLRAFLGLQPGQAHGTFQQWQALHDYWEQLGAAYGYCVEALVHNPRSGPAERLPLVMARCMRALGCRMKIEWMRYLIPHEATWAAMVRHYKAAVPLQLVATPVAPYRADTAPTNPGLELASAVMLQAAAPLTLTPRQIELVGRIASFFASSFDCGETPNERCPLYFDLECPGPPARVPEPLPPGASLRFIGAGSVTSKLKGILQHVQENGAAFLEQRFGQEFGAAEKIAVLEHLLRYWSDSPPSRQHARTSLQATLKVVAGLEPISNTLAPNDDAGAVRRFDALSFDGVSDKPAGKPVFAAPSDTWKLTDFSAHGLCAGFARRPDGSLKMGTPFIFKLERSQKWCMAVVRRLLIDERNQTEVGAQILAKAPTLVRLDTAGGQSGGALLLDGDSHDSAASALPGRAVLLPADPELKNPSSLMLEPGTNAPAQVVSMRLEETTQRIKLGEVMERGDGYERVAFEMLEG